MKHFKKYYKLPFITYTPHDTWVHDQSDNFCFQFEDYDTVELNAKILRVINGHESFTKEDNQGDFAFKKGDIFDHNGNHVITIRGWGNLTSPSCLNLSGLEAAEVQDSLGAYIVEQLNRR